MSVKALLLRLNLACFKLGKDRLRSKSAKDDQLRPVRYLSSDIRHFSLQWKHAVFMTTVIGNKLRNRLRVQKQESLKTKKISLFLRSVYHFSRFILLAVR